ncbi:MAG: response regulator transcription factor [Anaerolineales bacterium]|nr:response regulator transcription factor [Anaerolineales bacterium]
MTVVLADDHPIVRQGLRHLLDSNPEFHVVGEAGDGLEAIHLIETLKPNVLVVDMMMPGLNGLEVLRQLKKLSPTTRSIVLSMQSANAYVVEALKLGADGYILKETGPSELVNAIYAVIQGNRYISEKLAERLEGTGRQANEAPLDTYQTLTAREREILQLMAEGKSSAEIGEKLVISPRTVEVHRSKVMKKLALHNMAEVIKYAIKRGILPIDE